MSDELARAWDEAADGYEQYFVPRFRPWVEAAVAELGDLPPGPILVPCCGTFPELDLLLEQFPNREIVGIDLSAGMVELARQRASGHDLVSLVEGDAATLDPQWHRACSAVVSVFGLQQLPDPQQALSSWYDALRSEGRLSVVYWPSVTEEDGPFSQMKALLRPGAPAAEEDPAAVLTLDRDELVRFPITHDDAATFFEAYAHSGPMRATANARGAAYVEDLRAKFLQQAPDGEWTHRPAARLISATGRAPTDR
ncbi:methyltransferase domain-containing protein [Kribbella sp. NPDC051770]|uniref:class I SAM-dependent methyltransferase n=1 Tax=Kribbella sp. NPDC051770 TaxID=3155413 RepID=UPI003438D89B